MKTEALPLASDIGDDQLLNLRDSLTGINYRLPGSLLKSVINDTINSIIDDNFLILYDVLPELNISSADQTLALANFESGGISEKRQGYALLHSWTGGDGTYSALLTSGYGSGSGAFITRQGETLTSANLTGKGAGYLLLMHDPVNECWRILNDIDHVFDTFSTTASSVTKTYNKKIKNSILVEVTDANEITTNTGGSAYYAKNYSLDIAIGDQKLIGGSCKYSASFTSVDMYQLVDTTHIIIWIIGSSTAAKGYPYFEIKGTWR